MMFEGMNTFYDKEEIKTKTKCYRTMMNVFPHRYFFKFRAIVILFKTGNSKGFVSGKYVQFYDS